MPLSRPFATERYTSYAGDTSVRFLALAVRVVDGFTGVPAEFNLRVSLKERERPSPVRNRSGYFCFEGTPDGTYTLRVEPDRASADWFHSVERTVTLPMANPQKPAIEVVLSPKVSYPFPPGSTLLYGTVAIQGTPGSRVEGATVTCTYEQTDVSGQNAFVNHTVETQSDANGEFVLFFFSLLKPDPTVSVAATKSTQQVQKSVTLREGSPVTATLEIA